MKYLKRVSFNCGGAIYKISKRFSLAGTKWGVSDEIFSFSNFRVVCTNNIVLLCFVNQSIQLELQFMTL